MHSRGLGLYFACALRFEHCMFKCLNVAFLINGYCKQ